LRTIAWASIPRPLLEMSERTVEMRSTVLWMLAELSLRSDPPSPADSPVRIEAIMLSKVEDRQLLASTLCLNTAVYEGSAETQL